MITKGTIAAKVPVLAIAWEGSSTPIHFLETLTLIVYSEHAHKTTLHSPKESLRCFIQPYMSKVGANIISKLLY